TTAATAEAPKAQGNSGGGKAGPGSGGKISDARAAAMVNELNQLDMQMLGALNSKGSSTSAVLSGGDVPTGLLDNAAASGSGVGHNGVAGLNFGNGAGGTVRPGAVGGGGLASIGNTA